MNKALESRIGNVANKIAKTCQPDKIILFGSYAWGEPGPDSDIDILIIKKTVKPPHKRRIEASRAIGDRDFPVDVLVYTPSEIKNRLELGDFFIRDIISKGKTVYG